MKKIIYAVFAHPDDEAFGPSGTLLKEAAQGTEIHLVLLTAGDAGRNPDQVADLASVRLDEWKASGKLIGVTAQHFLGYKDGELNNKNLEVIGHQIVDIIRQTVSDDVSTIEIMSTDLNGITGHIDHIVAGRAAAFAFYHLKESENRLSRLRLVCVPRQKLPAPNADWIYAEPGRNDDEINETIDAREYRDRIIEIMKTHHSQREDCQHHLENGYDDIGLDYYLVKN